MDQPLSCPSCGQTGSAFRQVSRTAQSILWQCSRCQTVFPVQLPPKPQQKPPGPILCDCGRPARYELSVHTFSPKANTCGRAGKIQLCEDCRALELELRRQNGAAAPSFTTLGHNGNGRVKTTPARPKRRSKRRSRRSEPPVKFADFSLAKQAHIRGLLATLRQTVAEARLEARGELVR